MVVRCVEQRFNYTCRRKERTAKPGIKYLGPPAKRQCPAEIGYISGIRVVRMSATKLALAQIQMRLEPPSTGAKERQEETAGEQAHTAPHGNEPEGDTAIGRRRIVPLTGSDADILN